MAPHSSALAWKIPWTEEPGGLQSMGLGRVGHDWVTSFSLFPFMHWRRKWQPTPVFLPGESQGRGSLAGCRLWGHTGSDTTEVTAAASSLSLKTSISIRIIFKIQILPLFSAIAALQWLFHALKKTLKWRPHIWRLSPTAIPSSSPVPSFQAPQPSHAGWPVLPRTHPSLLSGFPGLFHCSSVPKVWIPSTSPLSPSITSCVAYHCALKPHTARQLEPWLPFSRPHGIFFILVHSHLPWCVFMLLSPTRHFKNLESRLVTFYAANLKFISPLFGYSKSSKYGGRNKLRLKSFLPLKYSIISYSWASASY